MFGSGPFGGELTVEVWLLAIPCHVVSICRTSEEDVMNLAKSLGMSAFDPQTGELIYYAADDREE